MSDELVDVVNYHTGVPIGEKIMKSVAHAKGICHPSAHVWIYNSKGEVLLQLRAKQKELFPSLWDISVAGHIGAGEGVIDCAIRELKEELGLDVEAFELKESFTFNLNVRVVNKEFCHVFLYKYDGSAEDLILQNEEVEKVKFFSIEFLKKEFSDSKKADNYLLPKNPSVPRVFELIIEKTGGKD